MENSVPAPPFGVSWRGYDRAEVDSYVANNARWAAQAWGRITDLERRLTELESSDPPERDRSVAEARRTVDQFVEQVDAKAAELEEAVRNGTRPQLDELRDRVAELEDERRVALAQIDRLRESLGSLSGGPGMGNGRDGGDSSGKAATAESGQLVPTFAVLPESDQ